MTKNILQKPTTIDPAKTYPLWLVLHGAYDFAEQAIHMFGAEAKANDAYLLAPQASRPCGDGFCWSFAKDMLDINNFLEETRQTEPIDPTRLHVIGFSMGCTIGCWAVAQNPKTFATFSALSMGSAFEPWEEHGDGGIDLDGMAQSAKDTHVLLAVDQEDPYGSADYYAANLKQFEDLGFGIDTLQPKQGVHDVTDEMKAAVLSLICS